MPAFHVSVPAGFRSRSCDYLRPNDAFCTSFTRHFHPLGRPPPRPFTTNCNVKRTTKVGGRESKPHRLKSEQHLRESGVNILDTLQGRVAQVRCCFPWNSDLGRMNEKNTVQSMLCTFGNTHILQQCNLWCQKVFRFLKSVHDNIDIMGSCRNILSDHMFICNVNLRLNSITRYTTVCVWNKRWPTSNLKPNVMTFFSFFLNSDWSPVEPPQSSQNWLAGSATASVAIRWELLREWCLKWNCAVLCVNFDFLDLPKCLLKWQTLDV